MERENIGDIIKELGLIGSLSADVGEITCYYDDKGNTYVIASKSEEYYGTGNTSKSNIIPTLEDLKRVIHDTGITRCESQDCTDCDFNKKSPEAKEFGNSNICVLLNDVCKTE